jgi:hypothetical protein
MDTETQTMPWEKHVVKIRVLISSLGDWEHGIRRDESNPLYSLLLSLFSTFLLPEDD